MTEIGKNIKKIRKLKKLTIQNIAEKTSLTRSLLSQIENNKANPSIKSLYAIAMALGVPILSLFTEESGKHSSPVVRREERKTIITAVPETEFHMLLPSTKKERVEFFHQVWHKGSSTLQPKNHSGIEFGIVLKGELTIDYRDKVYVLRPGDSIYIECENMHVVTNSFDGDTETFWIEWPQ
jgi:transcriptional regulator with XRE-family HTH domain